MSVSFSKVHEHDTHDMLRTSSREYHEDAARKTGSVEFQLDSALVSLCKGSYLTLGPVSTGMGDRPSYHLGIFARQPDQLSLLSSVGRKWVGQKTVMLCDWWL